MEDCHSNFHALMTDEKSAKVNNADGYQDGTKGI